MNDLRTMIEIGLCEDEKIACKAQWRYFEKPAEKQDIERVSRSSNDFYDELDRLRYYWYNQGYNVYTMKQCKEIFSESEYNKILQYALDEDPWEGTEYSADQTAVVIEKVYNPRIVESIQPLVKTEWGQDYPFNGADPKGRDLGCVTIAVAQIMRCLDNWNWIDWTNIPDSGSYWNITDEMKDFLYMLRCDLKVNDNGGSNIDNAEKTFNKFGYKCTKYKYHHLSSIDASLRIKWPVYSRGEDRDKGTVGHAWVVDGMEGRLWENEYRIFTLHGIHYPEFGYEEVQRWNVTYDSKTYYHMNWGWTGLSDGWFLDYDISAYNGALTYHFLSDRRDIIINQLR